MPPKPIIRAAAVQIAPDLTSRAGTMEKVLNAIADAAAKGADFIVFPETVVPYYPYFSFVLPPVQQGPEHLRLYDEAVVVPSPETRAVAEAAAKLAVVVVLGVNERDHGSLYNTQLVFDADGTLALKRRKITPTYHERMIWGRGDGAEVGRIRFPGRPRFYDLTTADGIPYSQIAVLHARDVLATTVLQTCIHFESRKKTCQFCAIGQSLAAGRTIAHKTPAQLAEVAKAAVELDGVRHMVLTTGTPRGPDRGAAVLADRLRQVRGLFGPVHL